MTTIFGDRVIEVLDKPVPGCPDYVWIRLVNPFSDHGTVVTVPIRREYLR